MYTRVATEQIDKKGNSIARQVKELTEYAKKHDLQIAEVISEIGSGVSEKRKGFARMLSMLSEGKYAGILCMGIDRLSRNMAVIFNLSALAQKKGFKIVTPTMIFENSPGGRFSLLTLSSVNLFEREISRIRKLV